MYKIFTKLFAPFLTIICCSQCSFISEIQSKRESVRQNLTNICDSLPISNVLINKKTSEIIKHDRGTVTNHFTTYTDCRVVKKPIFDHLESTGWTQIRENSSDYIKDDYVISVICGPRYFNESNENKLEISCSLDPSGDIKRLLK